MLFFRVFQHLLPRSHTWKLTIEKTLRRFFQGLAAEPAETKAFADDVYEDLFPETTRELAEWEKQFGLTPATDATEQARRLALAAEWQASGGQSPSYIQGVLHTAGFTDLFVHDWFEPGGPPYVARDPRDYTDQPLIGSWQCTGEDPPGTPLPSQPQCSAFASQPQCNGWLANDVNYLVNLDLTRRAPPPVSDNPDSWRYWFYVGGETFGDFVIIESARRAELERLVLKLRPLHLWVGMLVSYVDDPEDVLLTENDLPILTETGEPLLIE